MARPSPGKKLARAVLRRALKGKQPPDTRDNPDTQGTKGLVMRAAAKVASIVYPTNSSGNSMSVR